MKNEKTKQRILGIITISVLCLLIIGYFVKFVAELNVNNLN